MANTFPNGTFFSASIHLLFSILWGKSTPVFLPDGSFLSIRQKGPDGVHLVLSLEAGLQPTSVQSAVGSSPWSSVIGSGSARDLSWANGSSAGIL